MMMMMVVMMMMMMIMMMMMVMMMMMMMVMVMVMVMVVVVIVVMVMVIVMVVISSHSQYPALLAETCKWIAETCNWLALPGIVFGVGAWFAHFSALQCILSTSVLQYYLIGILVSGVRTGS